MEMTSNMTKKIDKELILSDVIVRAVLSIEADALGVTLEEYVDNFLNTFYAEPSKFKAIIEG